jgi:hypothetical protein
LKQRQPNYYAALEALANHQIGNRAASEPWLLLITSRVVMSRIRSRGNKETELTLASYYGSVTSRAGGGVSLYLAHRISFFENRSSQFL